MRYGHHNQRARFFRRAGCVAFAVLALSLFGALSLARDLMRGLGVPSTAIIVVASIIGVAAIGTLFGGMMRGFGRPLREIMDAADRVAEGDYTARVRESGPPPIRSLAAAFNTMTTRLGASDAQRRQLMADVSHELRTPLTIMQGRLEGLLDGVYPRDEQHLEDVLEETRVLSRLIEDECRHLHGRYVSQLPALHDAVEAARRDIPLRLTPRKRSARSIKMNLAARRRAAGGQR